MPRPTLSLTGTIKSEADLRDQYKDSTNLSARAAIYRFSTSPGFGPDWVFEQMLAEIPARAKILEIGCGPGSMWRNNLNRMPKGWRVRLTDLMSGMIAEARTALSQDNRFTFDIMDAQKLDLADGCVDAVVANHMLYHVPDLPRVLREIARVLKPGAKLFASTNSEHHMRRMKELIFEYLGDDSPIPSEIPFSLENGERQLQPFFEEIERRSLKGKLRVTEAQVIVRYILSVEGATQKIVGAKLQELHERVADEIRAKGAFVLSTDAGMFVARSGGATSVGAGMMHT